MEQTFGVCAEGCEVREEFCFPFGGKNPTQGHSQGKCSATEFHLSSVGDVLKSGRDQVEMAHTFNPDTWEVEAERSL